MTILIRRATIKRATLGIPVPDTPAALGRTITVGKYTSGGAPEYGFATPSLTPDYGALSDASFGADTIIALFTIDRPDPNSDQFRLEIDNETLADDVFTKLSLETSHSGIVELLSADASTFQGADYKQWNWVLGAGGAIYTLADENSVLSWDIT